MVSIIVTIVIIVAESRRRVHHVGSCRRYNLLYRASVSGAGGLVSNDTTTISTAAMSVIGTTGMRPNQASAPGVVAV